MSIWRWLQTTGNPLPLPKAGEDGGVVAVNKEVAAVTAAQGEKRKRGPYHCYGRLATLFLKLQWEISSALTCWSLELGTIQTPLLNYLMPLLADRYLLVKLNHWLYRTVNNVVNNCVHVCIVAMLVRSKSLKLMDVILSPGLKTLNILGINLFGFTVIDFFSAAIRKELTAAPYLRDVISLCHPCIMYARWSTCYSLVALV